MVRASAWVGLTLPGMIELPGSLAGMAISPRPQRGPLASQRMSLAIFIRLAANPLTAPEANTSGSCALRAWKGFAAARKVRPVSRLSWAATAAPNPAGALRPVPTAVPPMASSRKGSSAPVIWPVELAISAAQPPTSWPSVSGVASCRWVRPILTMSAKASAFSSRVRCRSASAGSSRSSRAETAATCMAVGKTSLELCAMLT